MVENRICQCWSVIAVGRVEFMGGVVGATIVKGGDEDREGVLGGYGVGVNRD